MTAGIYRIVNNLNGKFYVGSSKDIEKRLCGHFYFLKNNKHENKHLQNSYNKYGKDVFYTEIVEVCEPTKEKLLETEQFYLDLLQPYENNIGYNICKIAAGGDSITNHPDREIIIAKNTKQLIAYNKSEEGRRKNSERQKGKKLKVKNYLSEKQKQHYKQLGEQLKGISRSETTKQKVSEGLKKYHASLTEEQKQAKTEKSNKTKSERLLTITPEQLKQKHPNIKSVIINNILYISLSEASRKLKLGIDVIKRRVASDEEEFKNYKYENPSVSIETEGLTDYSI